MTYGFEYPGQRYAIPYTTLRREILLPEAVKGAVIALSGQRVEGNTIVAKGYAPAPHHIVDAAAELRLNRRQTLDEFLLVAVGDTVEQAEALASSRQDAERGRRAFSPVGGVIAGIEGGKIVVRERAEATELIAGMSGEVVDVLLGRGVVVETAGAVLQGVWGNGRRAVGGLMLEPKEGMEFIEGGAINLDWRGTIVVTKRRLTTTNFVIMEELDIAGVIAPSMDSTLIDLVAGMSRAVMLTEGFGEANMSTAAFSMLEHITGQNFNVRATLDAATPDNTGLRRPEVIINMSDKGEYVRPPEADARLRRGTRVRVTRAPYAGLSGVVQELPRALVPIGNGLRVPAAVVDLSGGDRVNIPLANLELYRG